MSSNWCSNRGNRPSTQISLTLSRLVRKPWCRICGAFLTFAEQWALQRCQPSFATSHAETPSGPRVLICSSELNSVMGYAYISKAGWSLRGKAFPLLSMCVWWSHRKFVEKYLSCFSKYSFRLLSTNASQKNSPAYLVTCGSYKILVLD